jgi:hypothetical protein
MTWASTLRCVTCDVEEFAFLFTLWAFLWQHSSGEDKSALATFPICLIALGTDISGEPSVCSVPAVGAFIFSPIILHVLRLPSFFRYFKIFTYKNL